MTLSHSPYLGRPLRSEATAKADIVGGLWIVTQLLTREWIGKNSTSGRPGEYVLADQTVSGGRAEVMARYRELDGDFPVARVLWLKPDGTWSDETDSVRSELYWQIHGDESAYEAREFNAGCVYADRLRAESEAA